MKKYLLYTVLILCCSQTAKAQYGFQEMVELSGVIMSSDSLRYLPFVAVQVEGSDAGVISNKKGVFSTIVPKGSKIKFSCLGFKDAIIEISDTLSISRYSVIQLMVQDTFYLPTTIIRPVMTREEFEKAFVKWDIPPDQMEIARRNTSTNTIRAMAFTLPKDGSEHADYYQDQELQRRQWAGQQPPMHIFSPLRWREFFRAWKRGDFKRK